MGITAETKAMYNNIVLINSLLYVAMMISPAYNQSINQSSLLAHK